MYYRIQHSNELYHYGIQGQKWGVRRYQNEDGTLTPEGKKRYSVDDLDRQTGEYYLKRGSSRGGVKTYKTPKEKLLFNSPEEIRKLNKQRSESILRYDASRAQQEMDRTGGYNYTGFRDKQYPYGKVLNLINHYKDKKGVIALSYARVPGVGDVYVKGKGKINDLDFNKYFKKVPKELKEMKISELAGEKNPNSIKTKIQKKGYKIASNYVTQKDASKTRNRVFNELNKIEKSGATISAKDIEAIKSEIQKDAPSDKKIDDILNKYK